MKIAFIVPYVPNRIRTRSFNLISHLSKLGHEVVVCTLGSGGGDLKDAELLRSICKVVTYQDLPVWKSVLNCAIALPSRAPLQSVYSWHRGFASRILELLRGGDATGFDLVHVEHLRGSRYGLYIKSKLPELPIVWDSVDSISHLFQQASRRSRNFFGRIMTWFELNRTRLAEGDLVAAFDRVLITSNADRDALLKLVRRERTPAPISVLPNGVDLDYFRPNAEVQRKPETIVFSGKMSYHANVATASYLVNEIMPILWEKRPNAQLTIVGKDPRQEIKAFANHPLITVTGTVEDIRPYLWGATVAAVPLVYGAGIQNKILEAMACGTPVVTTSAAISSLSVTPEQDILLGDTPGNFASKILQVMDNPNHHHEISIAGSSYVRHFHDWTNISRRLIGLYKQAISASKPKV